MRFSRAMLVARREWAELRQNRLLLASMAGLPILLTVMPVLITLVASKQPASTASTAELASALKDLPAGLTAPQMVILMVTRNFVGMFLMLPVFVPIVIAAQAVVGEKERRTIEPLLASPLSSAELLLGKTVAALVPGIAIAWGTFVVFAILIDVIAWPHFGRAILPDPSWLVAVFVVGPLLALFGNGLAVVISSRVNDARLAQQLAGTAVLPLVGIIVVQMVKGVAFGPGFYLVGAIVIALLDLVLYAMAIRLFDRERLLTSLR